MGLTTPKQIIVGPRGRWYDAAWLSHKVLAIASDVDGLEVHHITTVWPLTIKRRSNFYLPALMPTDKIGMLTLAVPTCVVGLAMRIVKRISFYDSALAREHCIARPRERLEEDEGIIVIGVKVSNYRDNPIGAYTLVVSLSYIVTLAFSEQVLKVRVGV